MARIIEDPRTYDTLLRDSATGKDCVTEKAVDVTADCPGLKGGDCYLLYARARSGRIVQIARRFQGETHFSLRIHYDVADLERMAHASAGHDKFGSWLDELGLSKTALHELIALHAPAAKRSTRSKGR